ncbi:unnamed protein product [Cylicostephanus goldi]|uniref:Uncharacterized protein n=1 Tax=Cylicostephanus goldi TaxID=71465 RepID=A0A3P6V159_CYLGO|nr:unnamed protein product [Cylicostephanus goldi]
MRSAVYEAGQRRSCQAKRTLCAEISTRALVEELAKVLTSLFGAKR